MFQMVSDDMCASHEAHAVEGTSDARRVTCAFVMVVERAVHTCPCSLRLQQRPRVSAVKMTLCVEYFTVVSQKTALQTGSCTCHMPPGASTGGTQLTHPEPHSYKDSLSCINPGLGGSDLRLHEVEVLLHSGCNTFKHDP